MAAASSSNSVSNSQCSSNITDTPVPKQELKEDLGEEMGSGKSGKGRDETFRKELENFRRYEADFRQYLMSKYFSERNIFGGNIYDVKVNTEGGSIMASRLPAYQSYLDPASFDELNSKGSTSPEETPSESTSNGKQSPKADG